MPLSPSPSSYDFTSSIVPHIRGQILLFYYRDPPRSSIQVSVIRRNDIETRRVIESMASDKNASIIITRE